MKLSAKNYQLKAAAGLTLLEALVYVALLVLILMFLISSLLSVMRVIAEVRISRNLNNSAVVALERLVRDIREAGDVDEDESVLGAHPGKLVITASDQDGNFTTTEFYLTAGILLVEKGGASGVPLTSSDLEVGNLVFRHIVSSSSQAVKIEMTLRNREGKTI